MIQVEIDASELEQVLNNIKEARRAMPRNLENAAKQAVKDIKNRIGEGKNALGHYMETQAGSRVIYGRGKKKEGRYSYRHGQRRLHKGLKVDVVNLKFTGATLRSFKVLGSMRSGSQSEVEVGFDDSSAARKAAYNDAYFGTAWAMKSSEADDAFKNYLKSFPSPLFDV